MASPRLRPEVELPLSVECKLSNLCGRHGQQVDRLARLMLSKAGEQVSLQALSKIERSRNPIQSLSKYIVCMIKLLQSLAYAAPSPQSVTSAPQSLDGCHDVPLEGCPLANEGMRSPCPSPSSSATQKHAQRLASVTLAPRSIESCHEVPLVNEGKRSPCPSVSSSCSPQTHRKSRQTTLSAYFQDCLGKSCTVLKVNKMLDEPLYDDEFWKGLAAEETRVLSHKANNPSTPQDDHTKFVDELLNQPHFVYDDDFLKDIAAEEERLLSPKKDVQKGTKTDIAGEVVKNDHTGLCNEQRDNPSTPECHDIKPPDVKQTCKRSFNFTGEGAQPNKKLSRLGRSLWLDELMSGIDGRPIRKLDLQSDSSSSMIENSLQDNPVDVLTKLSNPLEKYIRSDGEALYSKEDLPRKIPMGQMCYKETRTGCIKRIASPHLKALSELDQVRALLVLSCFLEEWYEALSVEDIVRSKDMCLEELEGRLKSLYAMHKNSSYNVTVKRDWSKLADHHVVFHCNVSRSGELIFKGPSFEQKNCPLQRVFGDGGVLRVHFADLENSLEAEGHYWRISREGIWVGLRKYEFYGFKDPKVKKNQGLTKDITSTPRCIFICTKSYSTADIGRLNQFENISDARNYMMHISTVPTLAKKIARLQLALSQTLPVLNLDDPNIKVEIIDDVQCRDASGNVVVDANGEPLIHTDGTGYVSVDIAAQCPVHVYKGKKQNSGGNQEYPLLMQVRIFYKGSVSKGTLLVNLKIPKSTIQIRPSMLKVKTDSSIKGRSFNSLELCTTSRKPSNANLFQHLCLLLVNGGVPDSVLLEFAQEAVDNIKFTFEDRRAAISAISKSNEQSEVRRTILSMLCSGIPLNDPYLQKYLWDSFKQQLQSLSKARIPVPETFNLMGCADPSGRLERSQVAIILENGPIFSTRVLVYKSPGLHPGDIHVFEATWDKEIEAVIGTGKYAIFFSVKGPRSVVDEIANSDLDGDQYWICLNPKLVKSFKPSLPWEKPFKVKVPKQSDPVICKELNKQQFESFLNTRFHPSSAMGIAANSWLAHMDRYLSLGESKSEERNYLQSVLSDLINTYYDAVDAEKSGEQVCVKSHNKAKYWPHYMEKEKSQEGKWILENTYHSVTVVGKIYDIVRKESNSSDFSWEPEEDINLDKRFQYPGFQEYFNIWWKHFLEYKSKVKSVLEDPHIEEKNCILDGVFQKYRKVLYGADTFTTRTISLEEIYKQASAIYCLVYQNVQRKLDSLKDEYSNQPKRIIGLQFAWRVAGIPLCHMYIEKSCEEPMLFSPSIMSTLRFVKLDYSN